MRILLLGAQGQVGSAILRSAPKDWDLTAWDRSDLDLADLEAVRKKLKDYRRGGKAPDFVINAAAFTQVDLAETQQAEAAKLNLDLPELMSAIAYEWKSRLVHFSTDYVYSGESTQPHVESEEPAPLNLYGKTKLFGDQAIMASGCEYLIFRTSWVYARSGKNFLLTMVALAASSERLRVVVDQIGSPTLADDLALYTLEAMGKALAKSTFPSGVYHLTNSGTTSWHGFAEAILKEAAQNGMKVITKSIVPVETQDYPTPAKRPLNSRLSLQKVSDTFGITPRPWQVAMKEVILSLKKGPRE